MLLYDFRREGRESVRALKPPMVSDPAGDDDDRPIPPVLASVATDLVAAAVRRMLPPHASIGDQVRYTVTLINRSGRHQSGLLLREMVADPRPSHEEFLAAREPGEAKRNFYDRWLGYHRYVWLTTQKRGAMELSCPVGELPEDGQARITMILTPLRRGRVHLVGLALLRPEPLVLLHAVKLLKAPDHLLVLPRRYRLPHDMQLPGGRQYQQGGVAMAGSVGETEEFVSLREFREGDSPRHIHWPSWAKTGKPLVKEYQEEFFVRHALILDTFSPRHEAAFEEAVSLAASFAATLEQGDSLLDLLFVGHRAHRVTAGRGVAHAEQLLEVLASVQPTYERDFSDLTALVRAQGSGLSGCVILLLAWDAPRRELVKRLIGAGVPLLVFHVLGEDEEPDDDQIPAWEPPSRFCRLRAGQIEAGLATL